MGNQVNKYLNKNPEKASSKVSLNNTFMGICFTIFSLMWALSPGKLSAIIIIQFIFSIPLLYVSSLSYAKVAYRENVRSWDRFGWIAGNTAYAFILNIIGILIFSIGYKMLSLLYFYFIWILLALYTITNYKNDREYLGLKLFKFFYFIFIQAIFGVAILYF